MTMFTDLFPVKTLVDRGNVPRGRVGLVVLVYPEDRCDVEFEGHVIESYSVVELEPA